MERVLAPALGAGDVVALDNLSSHLSPAAFEATERGGASVLPLPPYGPGDPPIGGLFSKSKESLRRFGARAEGHLHEAIGGS